MDTRKSKHVYVAIIVGFISFVLMAALYSPFPRSSDAADNRVDARGAQDNSSVSSFLNRIIGEPNETVDEPTESVVEPDEIVAKLREMTDEPELFEEYIWYAGTWDSTLYLKSRYPRTVAIKMKLLDKKTRLPIKGAGVSIKGEYEQTLTGSDIQSQVDLSIFHDLRDVKTLKQQRRFGLDAISDSKGVVVFALNWQKEYSWQDKTGDQTSPPEINPDGIECVARLGIRHPDCTRAEIPVEFKRKNIKPIVLVLSEGFSDFDNKHSRRTEFFEEIRAEDNVIAYGDVKESANREGKTKCGPYLVYDLGDISLECTAPPKKVRPPDTSSTKEPPDTPKPQPSRETRPSEETVEVEEQTRPDIPPKIPAPKVSEKPAERKEQQSPIVSAKTQEPKESLETVAPKDVITRESEPDQKSIEQPKPVVETVKADDRLPVASRTSLAEKIIDLGDSVTMRLQLIPKGDFQMGSAPEEWGRDADEGPAHNVRIDQPFYMGVYEVTQEQYEKVTGMNPSRYKRPKYPVHMVSWNDARAFCRRLSSLVGEPFRLPTEAEWEYACRAGTTTAYYWGNRFDDRYAWSLDNSKGSMHEAGTRLPNAWGLYDMSGNLWEWCEDSYDEYDPDSIKKISLKKSSVRPDCVLRGGSWNVKSLFSRSANRSRNAPDIRMDYNGFRVVLDVE